MIHVDVKKVGRIPDGGGWRAHGKGSAQAKAVAELKRSRSRTSASTTIDRTLPPQASR
jgi:hypothetical protein